MRKDNFNGLLLAPGVDFGQVRDGRRSPLFYYDVDLSTARSSAAGTALIIRGVSGDSFYVDKNPSLSGSAIVHFEDVTSGIAPAPVYCDPGFIANVPFTQLLIENVAQPGMIFRFFYGVGIDFQPGAASSIVISGGVTVRPEAPSASFNTVANLAANTAETIFLPAANPSGAILLDATAMYQGAAFVKGGFISKSGAAPATIDDGSPVSFLIPATRITGEMTGYVQSESLKYIPAGHGLYFICDSAMTFSQRGCRYILL